MAAARAACDARPMPAAYAIAHLRTPRINDDVIEYIERIQATLDPFGGRSLVHGGEVDVKEGPWPGTIVVIEFPALARRRRGITRTPTMRSSRCAPHTSRARRSSWAAWTPATTRRNCGRAPRHDGEPIALRRWRSSTSSARATRRPTYWRPVTGSWSTRSKPASVRTTGTRPRRLPRRRLGGQAVVPTLRSCRGPSTSAGGSCWPATSRPWRPIAPAAAKASALR